jgi:hypothetical protein
MISDHSLETPGDLSNFSEENKKIHAKFNEAFKDWAEQEYGEYQFESYYPPCNIYPTLTR